jgi:acetyl esterase/lipase
MLGSSDMVNKDQIEDCLSRGWIVVAPNHRLCPQVNLLEGPMQDCRDLLTWIYSGGLAGAISKQSANLYMINEDKVFAFGTSSGGMLALSLVCHPTPCSNTGKSTNRASYPGIRCSASSFSYI